MAKYYVTDGVEESVIDAKSPIQACFKCLRHRFRGVPVNGVYKVSELGFDDHDDDIIFNAGEVVELLLELMEKERKNDKNEKRDKDDG